MSLHTKDNDEERPTRLLWLPGIALGAIAALLVWPQTHRLVASQLELTIPTQHSMAVASPYGFTDPWIAAYAAPIIRKAADEHADDLQMQIAAATRQPSDGSETKADPAQQPLSGDPPNDLVLQRLSTLVGRFPQSPSVYATLLRYFTIGKVRVTQDEGRAFLKKPEETAPKTTTAPHSDPADVARFNAVCEAAEPLDPNNAFFPTMHAIGLIEAHNEAAALAALDRAAACATWTEYLDDECEGNCRLQETAFGAPTPMPRAGFAAMLLLPHLATLRGAMSVALLHAVTAEQSGNLAEGLRVRNSVRRIGSLMRSDERNFIGNLVGISLVRLSLMRPLGTPAGVKTDVFTDSAARDSLLRSYDAYLETAGHPELSAPVHEEIQSCVIARKIISESLTTSIFDTDLTSVISLSITDMILLSTVLWLAAMAGLAYLLPAIGGLRPLKRLPINGRRALMTLITVAATAAAITLLVQQSNGSIGLIARAGHMWIGSDDGPAIGHKTLNTLCKGYMGLVAAVPLLMVLTLTTLCLAWRVPVIGGVARGIRGSVLPVCSVILIAYSVMAPVTLLYGSRLDVGLTQTLAHEGRYASRTAGVDWPAAVK